jgi:hypothetical protein
MISTRSLSIALTLVVAASAICAAADAAAPVPAPPPAAEPLPAGEKVLDRAVEVTGGAQHAAVRTRVARGKISMPAMGLEGPLTLWQKAPNLIYLKAELAGVGTIESGHDGTIVWHRDMMTGARIVSGVERAMQLRDAEVDAAVWRKFFSKAETKALEDVGGKPAYKVVLTPHEGREVTQWFDRETGLLVKSEAVAELQMGNVPVLSWFEDYREADGVLSPRTVRQEVMGIEQRFTFDSIETNVELPADRFDPPADVVALTAKPVEPEPAPAPPGD